MHFWALWAFISTLKSTKNTNIQSCRQKFGDNFEIDIKLPSKDRKMVVDFLSGDGGIERLLEATWDKDEYEFIEAVKGNNKAAKYALGFDLLKLPGLGSIRPRIEVVFEHEEERQAITMKSGDWKLVGTSDIVHDLAFIDSFSFKIEGYLAVGPSEKSYTGMIKYEVSGPTPSAFQSDMSDSVYESSSDSGGGGGFLLKGVINAIQLGVKEFAVTRFKSRILQNFRRYMLKEIVQKR